MKVIKYNNLFAFAALSFLLASCASDAPDVALTVTADKTTVKVGEPVTLNITHNAMGVSVFNGEEGHDYYNSALYLLSGKTEEELKSDIFRQPDPDIKPMLYDFSDTQPGASQSTSGFVEAVDLRNGGTLIGSEAEFVTDPISGGTSLCFESTHPEWWYQSIRINTDSKLGSNQKMTLSMHFEKDILEDTNTGEKHPEIADFCVVVRIGGKGVGSDEVVFSENTVWDIYWKPSLTMQDYTIDLSRVIPEWQSGTGMELETLSYVQILFSATGTVGYVGKFWIDKVTFGDYDYKPFDQGEALVLGSGPGTYQYTHSFSSPGVYEMVVVGTNTSWKNYKGDGYKNSVEGKISADEYNYSRETRSVKITVTE